MKKLFPFMLFILLLACQQSNESSTINDASKPTVEEPKSEEDIISEIKEVFVEINQNTDSYEVKSNEITEESTEGGELKSYYQNEELKKIVADYFGEMGRLLEEYYFHEDQVFFVFTKQLTYDKPMYVEGSKVINTEENRYYFHDSKLVRWLDANNEKVDSSNFSQIESDVLQDAKALKEEF